MNEEQLGISEWISVEDKLPEDDENVIGYNKKIKDVPVNCWFDGVIQEFIPIHSTQTCCIKIDYWSRLPSPPKMSKE